MIQISGATIGAIIGVMTIIGSIFGIFFYFQKPQITLASRLQTLEEEMKNTTKEVEIIKATHFENNGMVQKEMKEMTIAVNELGKTVVRLSTIIDERIPKGAPSLTPPGQ